MLDAYFSTEENLNYQSGNDKRILYVFTNPKADFKQIIKKYNDIKFLAIFSGTGDISENIQTKDQKNPVDSKNEIIYYSIKTQEFSKDFKGLKLTIENYVINKIRENMDKKIELGIIEGRKAIDEIFNLSKSIYVSFIKEDNAAIKKTLSTIKKEQIKSIAGYITAFIESYYSMKLKIGANGAYLADANPNEEDLNEKKEKIQENTSKNEVLEKSTLKIEENSSKLKIKEDEFSVKVIKKQIPSGSLSNKKYSQKIPKKEDSPEINDETSLDYSSAIEYNGFDEIEPEDEVELKDEREFEDDHSLDPILSESRVDLDQEREELKESVKKFELEFVKISSVDKNLYKCVNQLLHTYKKIVQDPYVYENPVTPEQIYVELRLSKWKNEIPIDFIKKWFYLHLQKIVKLQKSGENERDDLILFEKELSWFLSILKIDINSKIPLDLSDLEILKQKLSKGAFKKQSIDNNDSKDIKKKEKIKELPINTISSKNQPNKQSKTPQKLKNNNGNDSINASIQYISKCIKNDRIPDFDSFKKKVSNLIKFVKS